MCISVHAMKYILALHRCCDCCPNFKLTAVKGSQNTEVIKTTVSLKNEIKLLFCGLTFYKFKI